MSIPLCAHFLSLTRHKANKKPACQWLTALPEWQQLGTQPNLAVHNKGIASSEPYHSEPPVPLDTARLAWSRSCWIFGGVVGRK